MLRGLFLFLQSILVRPQSAVSYRQWMILKQALPFFRFGDTQWPEKHNISDVVTIPEDFKPFFQDYAPQIF